MRIRQNGIRHASVIACNVISAMFLVLAIVLGIAFHESRWEHMNDAALPTFGAFAALAAILVGVGALLRRGIRYAELDAARREIRLANGDVIPLDRVTAVFLTSRELRGVSPSGMPYTTTESALTLVTDDADGAFSRLVAAGRNAAAKRGDRSLPLRSTALECIAEAFQRGAEGMYELASGAGDRYALRAARWIQTRANVPRIEFGAGRDPRFVLAATP